ncbi:phosphate/phosphite/phosphonate ABC transporter substrate-binding protein [Dongia soli]|uniref:PhnD/SsuA/transferrin family substrate-binding protein n=1 Tax=Dongia soli TaxID=600628 RepID=A0ABU5E9B2_9PROT|nr:PhnD/SsuA/transferrin family substrate-binding protein [Dongia soli]MDY0882931.1 PhnD/SsuA/transferrin family substrate-binding protein [Dongia soli]
MIMGLPMYALPELSRATLDWWIGLCRHFRRAGIDDLPLTMAEPRDLYEHWRQPSLLFTQTCGYPLTHDLDGQVQLVATPCYRAPGCNGSTYRSSIVIRDDDAIEDLADLKGKRIAFNSRDSQSGYNCLRHLISPLARDGRFFAEALETGGHRRSLAAVRHGKADVASIDCVSYALIAAVAPVEVTGIRVLCESAPAPNLPYITAAATPPQKLARLQDGLRAATADPHLTATRDTLLIEDVTVLQRDAYDLILSMERAAIEAGYRDLD